MRHVLDLGRSVVVYGLAFWAAFVLGLALAAASDPGTYSASEVVRAELWAYTYGTTFLVLGLIVGAVTHGGRSAGGTDGRGSERDGGRRCGRRRRAPRPGVLDGPAGHPHRVGRDHRGDAGGHVGRGAVGAPPSAPLHRCGVTRRCRPTWSVSALGSCWLRRYHRHELSLCPQLHAAERPSVLRSPSLMTLSGGSPRPARGPRPGS